jgi:hypothetical protein
VALYYGVWRCTAGFGFVLQTMTLYYRLRLCTTDNDFVLQTMTLYYTLCTWDSCGVFSYSFLIVFSQPNSPRLIILYCGVWLRTTALYYGVWGCTTGYVSVLRSMILHYGIWLCTTESDFVLCSVTSTLRNTSEYYVLLHTSKCSFYRRHPKNVQKLYIFGPFPYRYLQRFLFFS